MASSAVTCMSAANFAFAPRRPTSPPAQKHASGVPTAPQFYWARPQSTVFASSSGAMGSWSDDSNNFKFVRPDLVEAADEALATFVQISNNRKPRADGSRPQFRSALEQVSFETNHSLESFQSKPKNEGGFFSRAAKILRK